MEAVANILLVDDVHENLVALAALLRQPQVEIFCAPSATDALELMLLHDFALAVIDVQMPEVDGFELAELMRSATRTRHIPILFVTAGSIESASAFRGYESGAIDFMYKPLDNHAVKSKVNVFVDLYRQRAELNRQLVALQESERSKSQLLERLQNTQEELQKAMRQRDEFMSVVSHELRTPLNTLKLELYMRRLHLENEDAEAFSFARIAAMVEKDERQLNRLVHLINDMTDVSRIQTGQLSMQPVETNLAALVHRAVDQLAAQVEMAGCEVRTQLEESLLAVVDEFRIEQALINLLTNAIRHCDNQPIEVSLRRLGGHARLAVRDYGRGIQPADCARIFQQFERGNHERKGSGLGLGLFIANQIVRAHGGILDVESRPGEGAEFTILLPLAKAH